MPAENVHISKHMPSPSFQSVWISADLNITKNEGIPNSWIFQNVLKIRSGKSEEGVHSLVVWFKRV